MDVKTQMEISAKNLLKEVCSIDSPEKVEQFLERALGIERKQALLGDEWVTSEYELTMTVGGPNTYLKVDDVGVATARAEWGSEKYETFKKCYGAKYLFEYLREVYG